ncbi:MAG: hypothetical protein ACK51N_03890 [bacterium]|nr:hypothetical protein [Phycisphaerales bacterium]MCE2653100.1 hypothetical protein [Planctomycetaceae bacterium]
MNVSMMAAAVAACTVLTGAAAAQIPNYTLVGQFPLLTGGDGWDVGPDGRVVQMRGNQVWRQDAPGGSSYSLLGTVPAGAVSPFGTSFVRVSPAGGTLAFGDNNFGSGARVHFVGLDTLSVSAPAATASVLSGSFDAAWDGNALYVTGAGSDFVPYVNRITFTNVTGTPVSTTIITGIGGGSGGVAIFGSQLVTGVGFGGPGLPTGQVRAFDLLAVNASPSPTPFTAGAVVGSFLSASPLGYDRFGNLLAGGGDAFGGSTDIGYAAVVNPASPGEFLRLSPAGTSVTYGVRFNAFTDELLVTAGGIAYRYAVPGPAAAGLLLLAGLTAARRRR